MVIGQGVICHNVPQIFCPNLFHSVFFDENIYKFQANFQLT